MCSPFAVWPFVWPSVAVPLPCLQEKAERRAPIARRACSSSVSCAPCGAYPIRTCMTGSRVGLLWPWPVACLSTTKDSLAFLAHHNSANVATLPAHLCMSHFLSWSFCKRSDDDSSAHVISSLIVLPSSPGDVVIPMQPLGTLPLTILVLSCEAFVCTPLSVAVLACLSSFCSLLLTRMMHRLQNSCWHGRCVCITSVLVLSVSTQPIGACASLPGSMPYLELLRLSLGIPKTRRSVPACLPPGPQKNLANEVASSASLDAFFSFFTSNAHPCVAGLRLPRRWP